jgi:hypothetical protein
MLRRWIIRGLGIALLTLCVTAWVWSYWWFVEVDYSSGKVSRDFIVMCGRMRLARQLSGREGWSWDYGRWTSGPMSADQFMSDEYPFMHYHLGGFALSTGLMGPPDGKGWKVHIPLFFPTLLSAPLLWLVWRKTRPKYSGKGFPVEVEDRQSNP